MQRHERLFKLGRTVGPARADCGSHQLICGSGERSAVISARGLGAVLLQPGCNRQY